MKPGATLLKHYLQFRDLRTEEYAYLFDRTGIINARKQFVCNGSDPNITGSNCNNSITALVTTERMSRTPDERLFSSGDNSSFGFTQCYVSFGDPDGEGRHRAGLGRGR